ncbi:MAG: DinB family protein [Sphingobacteriia bacterium]|nr:DinB family protein [Sphingobacteriia bacterium]NCC38466.1 DinB family protein [Gammaproteobacteria bacterium]
MSDPQRPQRDPARPGIPWHERRIADVALRLYASLHSPAAILESFRHDALRAGMLARGLSETQGRTPVRIARFPGIESSSRNWSVYMTLDHLVMVNTAIMVLLHAICSDHNHGAEIGLEDVEPHRDAGPDRIPALEAAVERYSDLVERLGPLRSRERHPHPWFGQLSARQWHAVAAIHNRTHRIQIERILRRLQSS